MHSYNVPISIGGIQVNPGDIIFGDANGVVAIPGDHFATLFKELMKAFGEEESTQQGLIEGESAQKLFREHGRF